MEHRASTRTRQLTLCLIPGEIFPFQLCHSRTSPGVLGSSSPSLPLWVPLQYPLDYMSIWSPQVWPIHPQALCLISCSIGRCPVCLQSSLLLIFLGHQIRKMFLRLLLMNTCNFCSSLLVNLQVSEPYKSTAFTFDPKTLSLVLVVGAVDRQIGLNIANACFAFSNSCVNVLVSASLLAYNAPKVCKLIHFLNRPPMTDTPSSHLVPIRINFVLVALIFRPTFALYTSKACVVSLISCILCDST